jgi:flagellum-specific ATP synthase
MLSSPTDLVARVRAVDPIRVRGRIVRVVGLVAESVGPEAAIGEVCHIHPRPAADGSVRPVAAEVVGFRDGRVLLMPLAELDGLAAGCEVVGTGRVLDVPVGDALLGRVIDGLGRPIDGGAMPPCTARWPLHREPPAPLSRRRLERPFATGIRVIDGMATVAEGQRLGVFAGSGVGKSVLLGMIARHAEADVSVVGLVGERGREVREFIERDLGDGLAHSVVVVSTSDQPALRRLTAARTAIAVAEYFREQGKRVLLLVDSLTRVAMAQREIGLAAGEPPATRGYPPSVFAMLPQLLERSGMASQGSITGIYAVLVEGDDMMDPVADTVRSILDGHLVLARRLANRGHYPAIDPLDSISRAMADVVSREDRRAAEAVRALLARYRESEDLIQIGAYSAGSDPLVDLAIEMRPAVDAFLAQDRDDSAAYAETWAQLRALGERAHVGLEVPSPADGGAEVATTRPAPMASMVPPAGTEVEA